MSQRSLILLISATACLAGCGKKGPSIQTYPVSGIVTYNNKPVAGATVGYLSSDPAAFPTSGITDSEGRFSLSTYVGPKEVLRGAVPGDYKVTIVKMRAEAQQAAAETADWSSMSPAERQKMMDQGWKAQKETEDPQNKGSQSKSQSEIPEKYAKKESSDLTATVVVGENEQREFKLTDN